MSCEMSTSVASGQIAERDALHRADVVIARAEVGQQRDDGAGHRLRLANYRATGRQNRGDEPKRELRPARLRRLAEEDLAEVVLQQERIGDAQTPKSSG